MGSVIGWHVEPALKLLKCKFQFATICEISLLSNQLFRRDDCLPSYKIRTFPAFTFLINLSKPFTESTCNTVLHVSMGINTILHTPTTKLAIITLQLGPQASTNFKSLRNTSTPSFAAVLTNLDNGACINTKLRPR